MIARFLLVWSLATGSLAAQDAGPGGSRPDQRDGWLTMVSTRFAFLALGSDTFGNRPLAGFDFGLQRGEVHPGGGPSIAFTLGATLADGEFLAESKLSYRVVAGIETPVALAVASGANNPIELVPSLQVGYMKAVKEDKRSGVVARLALAVRLLPSDRAFFFSLEPLALVRLPGPANGRSEVAVEMGVLKLGWRF